MLEVRDLCASYGDADVLSGVDLSVREGEIVALLGANGAGKTSLINTVCALLRPKSGSVTFRGAEIVGLAPHRIVEAGIVQVPEGRKLFPRMTVLENLELGAYLPRARRERAATLRQVFALFPHVAQRRQQIAATLSGGEQRMVAIARALMALPRLLILDEPSLGLAPLVVDQIFEAVAEINRNGITVLLVEQNVHRALALCSRGFVLENGRICLSGSGEELLANQHVKVAYLGI